LKENAMITLDIAAADNAADKRDKAIFLQLLVRSTSILAPLRVAEIPTRGRRRRDVPETDIQ
jgi:hypothetical protein